MRHEFRFAFDVPFIKNALRRDFLWRGYVAAGLVVVLAVILRLWQGYWEPWSSSIMAFLAVFVVLRFHRLLTKFATRIAAFWSKQSPSGFVRYELDEDGFDVVLDNSRSHYDWSGLRRLWRYDDVWLVEIVKMQSVFFPPDQAPEEARDYIVERCRAAGVRVS